MLMGLCERVNDSEINAGMGLSVSRHMLNGQNGLVSHKEMYIKPREDLVGTEIPLVNFWSSISQPRNWSQSCSCLEMNDFQIHSADKQHWAVCCLDLYILWTRPRLQC